MKTIHRTIVSALLFSKDKKLFMGKKDPSKGGVYLDCWHIPGGGVDEGEDQLDALKREILEETGTDISPYPIVLIDNLGSGESVKMVDGEEVLCKMSFIVYRVEINDKNANEIAVYLHDDLVEHQWVSQDEMGKYKLTPPSEKLFSRLGML